MSIAAIDPAESSGESPYRMTVDLNVLNHLGINLYSNVPAVISEAVANAWDADAAEVSITFDPAGGKIIIADDGHGMDIDDMNKKYLTVGYRRRERGESKSPKGRTVTGRKGIGKLSLFSIADIVEVHSVKGDVRHGLKMSVEEIKQAIEGVKGVYHPIPVSPNDVNITCGTRIILTQLKHKRLSASAEALRKRLARRFSLIGSPKFRVLVNGIEVTVRDRDDLRRVQFLWEIGERDKYDTNVCPNLKKKEYFDGRPQNTPLDWIIKGWIGSTAKPKQLETSEAGNLNSIVVLSRGRLFQENILDRFNEGGLYTKYLTGQLEADFLDLDDREDIATSDRQRGVEDDERYQILEAYVKKCLRNIEGVWTEWRKSLDVEGALQENPILEEWLDSLPRGSRRHAENLIKEIESYTLEKEDDKRQLYRYGIIAFERLRLKEQTEELVKIFSGSAEKLLPLLADMDDIEAALYRDIVKSRLQVIRAFLGLVDMNEKEKVLQKYLFDHLWLLDPSWERATGSEIIEQRLDKEFENIYVELTEEERQGRVDIKYRNAAGKHIVVELKRAARVMDVLSLVGQGRKYQTALQKCLKATGHDKEFYEIVFVLGRPLRDGDDDNFVKPQLASINGRIVQYDHLIHNASRAYAEYLEASKSLDRIASIVDKL